MIKHINLIKGINSKMREKAELMEENVQKLEEIERDADAIISRKLKNLNNMTRGIMERRLKNQRKDNKDKIDSELSRIMSEIKELRDNPEEALEEERASLQEFIEEEREKLNQINFKAEFYAEFISLTNRVSKVVNRVNEKLDEGQKLQQSSTEILLEAYPILVDMKGMSKRMAENYAEESEEIRNILEQLMEGEVITELGFDGITQTSSEEVDDITRDNEKWRELNEQLEEIMNRYDAEVERVTAIYEGE